MKKYRFLSLILLFTLALSLVPSSAAPAVPNQEDLDLFCTHAVLLDANHGEILYNMRANEKAYPASITKIMTALLVLEAIDNGALSRETVLTASELAVNSIPADGSTAGIKVGE